MPFNFGFGELVTMLGAVVVMWGIPIAAALWAVRTLAALGRGQRAILARLDALEAAAPRQAQGAPLNEALQPTGRGERSG